MFSKQCKLLIDLERPSELTSRSLKFIHNTIHELRLLEVGVVFSCNILDVVCIVCGIL